MIKDSKLGDLARIPLFTKATRRDLERIGQCSTQVRVSPGQVLCRQGVLARQVIVLEDGHASVDVDGRQVDELVRGDVFGEAAVLATARYDGTVIALDAVRLLVFTPAEFSTLLAVAPFVAERLLRARAARVGSASSRCQERLFVPAQRTSSDVPHALA
jgi:CRP-like cAMP-binding protein